MDSLPDIPSPDALTANSLFQNAFEFAAIGMALVSSEGKWLRVNRSICEITGYSEAELLTRTFQDITHPDDLDLDLANVSKMLAGEIKTYQMEKRYFHKDGSIVWVLLSVSLVHNRSGAPLFFYLTNTGHHSTQTNRRTTGRSNGRDPKVTDRLVKSVRMDQAH